MDFEKLGAFYLGKEYDLKAGALQDKLVMYDARDLTTHAVCVGMTGSGKTGLCLDLLEEAALDQVPALIIDPKGDLTNLLLTFPDLLPADFRPWINVDDARRKGLSEDEFAAQQADSWRKGLADWGQDGERIRTLRKSTDFVIYTPGSDAGIPVSIMASLAAPKLDWDAEAELLRERIQGTVSALLELVGIAADPIRSREHILLSSVIEHYWRQGKDLSLPDLILATHKPPMSKLGVFDIDTFFPEKERFELSMALNSLIAAPGFQTWLQGQPLDITAFLASPEGKTRHSIFYIAHLSDAERMFFVTLLLNQLISWMRTQPGTTSLRALLYMDEVFGYFPPTANPPSKKPLLTLMKQARAFGVGVVLATQNPADLDYKGLTNAGTWFIGRLQAERDKMRLLDGLESASAEVATTLDRGELDQIISGLGKRVFLLHNVNAAGPVTFQTRWAMSYLRGPLTRLQVRELMKQRQPDRSAQPAGTTPASAGVAAVAPQAQVAVAAPPQSGYATVPPMLPGSVQQVYLPLRKGVAAAQAELAKQTGQDVTAESHTLLYFPSLLGAGQVHFLKQTASLNVSAQKSYALLAQFPTGTGVFDWAEAEALEVEPRQLLAKSEPEARFASLPEGVNVTQAMSGLRQSLEDHVYRTYSLDLMYSPVTKLVSKPGEDERAFSLRVNQAARELRDAEIDKLEERYATKLDSLEDRLRTAQAALDKREASARARKTDALLTGAETVISLFAGRRRSVSAAARKVGNISTAKQDLEAAEEKVADLQADQAELQKTLKEETDALTQRWEAALSQTETLSIKPKRTDVEVTMFAVVWVPYWSIEHKQGAVVTTSRVIAY